jgi:uncharacterized membrane protein (GlpM family)
MTQTVKRLLGGPGIIELNVTLIMTLRSRADGFYVSKLLKLAPDFTVIYDLIRVTQGHEQSSLQLLIFVAALRQIIIPW